MAEVFTDDANVVFGIAAEVAGLITSKVSITRKVDKKELRGRMGGYKSVVAYGKVYEASVEGAFPGGAFTPVALADTVAIGLTDMTIPANFFVESATINETNEGFKTMSLKLFGSDDITLA